MIYDISNYIFSIENFCNLNEEISIVLLNTLENNILHCGVFYKDTDNKPFILHLAWHCCLRNDSITNLDGSYKSIKTNIHIDRQKIIAAKCFTVWKKCNVIPYGINYKTSTFTKDGLLKLGNDEHGLTCATFVLSIFESCGFNLIDIDSWEPRSEDNDWHNYIIQILERTKVSYKVSQEHINNIINEFGCARFRPEEVAISSTFLKMPAPNNDIIERGKILKDIITKNLI